MPISRRLSYEFLETRDLLSTVTLFPTEDGTLYESGTGATANGKGQHLFVGRTGQDSNSIRRGLLRFDIAEAVPLGSTISSVSLQLNMSRTVADAVDVALHRVLAEWGEGNSDASGQEGAGTNATAGDATWIHRRFGNQLWQKPGGDFADQPSGVTTVVDNGRYQWTNPGLLEDVRSWLADPGQNFGWLLRGNESTPRTAKRFDSRENPNEQNRPQLTIEFEPPAPVQLTISDAAADEGNDDTTQLAFRVAISRPTLQPVTVQYETAAGSALAGEDFIATSGQVVFEPGGELVQDIVVSVMADSVTEEDETFTIRLFEAQGADLVQADALGTIRNDDPVPQIQLSDVTIDEGNEGEVLAPVVLTLSHPSALPVSVVYRLQGDTATADEDFRVAQGQALFAPGETNQVLEIAILADRQPEPDESLVLQLSDPVNAELAATGGRVTIRDDDATLNPWHNALLPEDVDGDGLIIPLDALLIINELNRVGAGSLPDPPLPGRLPPPFLDVDNDHQLAPIDALLVINLLNSQAPQAASPAKMTSDSILAKWGKSGLPKLPRWGQRLLGDGFEEGDREEGEELGDGQAAVTVL